MPHPSTLTSGLHDGCPRCEELARNPLRELDAEHLGDLWLHMVMVEQDRAVYRSHAEARACRELVGVWVFLQRYVPEVDADCWPPLVRRA
jgi:hypothetical protein